MSNFVKRSVVAAAGVAIVGLVGSQYAAAGNVTVTSWGGSYSESQRKAYHEPFMKETGHTVLEDEWGGDLAKIRAMVETENYTTHLIDAESHDVAAGCDEGILEPIDYGKLGFSGDDMLPEAAHECGVGTISWSTIFAYDKDQVKGDGPQSWADFWDVNKFPGKRGLYKKPNPILEFALMADGVPADKIYETLGSEAGIDRAFAKLDALKEHIVWWESGAQAPQLLADKEVVMTSAWNGRIYTAIVDDKRNFEIVWDGQIMDYDFWVIPKGHPEVDLAYEYIAFASRPDRQGDQTNYIAYGPLRKGADKHVNPDILPHLPTAPSNTKNWLKTSTEFWADNTEELEKRFNAWVSK